MLNNTGNYFSKKGLALTFAALCLATEAKAEMFTLHLQQTSTNINETRGFESVIDLFDRYEDGTLDSIINGYDDTKASFGQIEFRGIPMTLSFDDSAVLTFNVPEADINNLTFNGGTQEESFKLLKNWLEDNKDGLNFIGNIEGKEIFLGDCDVVVCDGFVGNVALKTIEGASSMLFKMIMQEFKRDPISMIIGLLAKSAMKRIFKRINYEEFGGALLLGVKGITVISHGRSMAYAIKNAVRVAKEAVESEVNKKISEFYEG